MKRYHSAAIAEYQPAAPEVSSGASSVDSVDGESFPEAQLGGGSLDLDGEDLLVRFERVLRQEETALISLQQIALEERHALVRQEPRDVLQVLQRIEEVLGRVRQLEVARSQLATRLAAGVNSPPCAGRVAEVANPSPSAQIQEIRHRIFIAAGRVAQLNEANRHLIAGLTRISAVALARLLLFQEADTRATDRVPADGRTGEGLRAVDVSA